MNTTSLIDVGRPRNRPRAHVVDVVRGGSLKGEPPTSPRHHDQTVNVGRAEAIAHVNPYRESASQRLIRWGYLGGCHAASRGIVCSADDIREAAANAIAPEIEAFEKFEAERLEIVGGRSNTSPF